MKFNSEQQLAIDSNANKILCLAGAGAGKTAVMINRISRIVNDGVDPECILALTFTNVAAFEMKQRYCKLHNTNICPEFKTFHAFCYSLISKDIAVRNQLGYQKLPEVATDADIKRLSYTAKIKSGVKLANSKLSGKTKCSNSAEEFQLKIYKKYLTKLLKQNNLITFDILCYDTAKLFTDNDPSIFKYKTKYKYVFVDEFQDTDPRQWEFVKSFDSANMFIVADVLQSIYKFRGADDTIVKALAVDNDWTTIKLFQNYRSVKKICDFANQNSVHGDDSYRIIMNSDKLGGFVTESTLCDSFDNGEFSELDLTYILDKLQSNEFKGTTAILCRSNQEVNSITKFLKQNNVELNNDTSPEYTDILRSVLSDSYLVEWLSTCLNSEMYSNYLRNISLRGSDYTAKEFSDNYRNVFAINLKLKIIAKIRNILKSEKLSCIKASEILSIFNYTKPVSECGNDYADIITYVYNTLSQVSESYIYVGTIHSSKGLEYDNVILPNVGGYSFKLSDDQNKNLYYVGITRAKTNLVVMYGEEY